MAVTIFVTLLSSWAQASATLAEPNSFKSWKDQQVIDAQNQLARVANRLTLVKAGKIKAADIAAELNGEAINASSTGNAKEVALAVESSRVQKIGATDVVARLERDQERAQKNLEFAKDVTLEDYFLVYLAQFQNNPEALQSIAGKLSKEEVVELMRALLKSAPAAPGLNGPAAGQGGAEPRSRRPALGDLEASALSPHSP